MNIILQNYSDLLKKVIFDIFSSQLKGELDKISPEGNVFNYINILSTLDESLCEVAKKALIQFFDSLDKSYRCSSERMKKYDVKARHTRTILTIFGEITFYRTFYISKANQSSFCYLDRLLGLRKYDYFDPYLKALIMEYVSNHSYGKSASYVNDLIENRIKLKKSFQYFSRQTVRNIVMREQVSIPEKLELETPETLYIIADEKFIPTQNNDNKDIMVKSVIIFDGINKKNPCRPKLNNKMIFASYDSSYKEASLDYIYKTYHSEKIKNIFIMGDGASWIKHLRDNFKIHPTVQITFALDKFHFKQAIHHILPEKEVEDALSTCIINNKKNDFIRLCDEIIDLYPDRKETILSKRNYILNHWHYILNLYKYHLSCPMESQISHNIADLFTSRPKAYSVKTLNKLLELRLLFKNGFNIKELFLNNFHSKVQLTINDNINYSIFEMYDKKETYTVISKQGKFVAGI